MPSVRFLFLLLTVLLPLVGGAQIRGTVTHERNEVSPKVAYHPNCVIRE
jgi:hypothetical protein